MGPGKEPFLVSFFSIYRTGKSVPNTEESGAEESSFYPESMRKWKKIKLIAYYFHFHLLKMYSADTLIGDHVTAC